MGWNEVLKEKENSETEAVSRGSHHQTLEERKLVLLGTQSPRWGFFQGACWWGKKLPVSLLPYGRTHRCSHCNSHSFLPWQPACGTLVESHPEHQMAHQRAESNFSHRIASASSAHYQFKAVSLPNWLLLSLPENFFKYFFFFLATQTLCSASFGWKI